MDKFGLNLHPKKTRLIEFGRGSAARREREGRGKCETFDFLGFTFYLGRSRRGYITPKLKTSGKRLRGKLKRLGLFDRRGDGDSSHPMVLFVFV